MTNQTAPVTANLTTDVVPSAAANRAISWIRVSVLLTVVNALLIFFGTSVNFIFGMTWSYPIEDLAYGVDNALGALVVGILLTLPMLWVANRARTHPRLMLAIAAAVYLIGALVAIAVYGDFIAMAGQLVIFGLAVLGAKSPVAIEDLEAPAVFGGHDVVPASDASIASPVAYPTTPAAPQTAPGSGGVAVLDAP